MDINAFSVADLITAIHTANSAGVPVTIHLEAGAIYNVTAINDPLDDGNGLPNITGNITFDGRNATIQRDPSSPNFRIFHIDVGATVVMDLLTIKGGKLVINGQPSGGGILNKG